jgi:hypothetical protein
MPNNGALGNDRFLVQHEPTGAGATLHALLEPLQSSVPHHQTESKGLLRAAEKLEGKR